MRLSFYLVFVALLHSGCDSRKNTQLKEISQVSINDSLKNTATVRPDSVHLSDNTNVPSANKESFPKELLPFVISEFQVYSYKKGDLNKDGLSDYILILEDNTRNSYKIHEEEVEEENESYTPPERELRVDIIIRQNDKLKYYASNYYLYSKKEWDTYRNDSIRLAPNGDGFIVSYSSNGAGPFSIYSNLEFHFKYSKKNDLWYLVKKTDISGYNSPAAAMGIKMGQAQQDNPNYTKVQLDSLNIYSKEFTDKEEIQIETPKDFGVVSFKQFRKSHYF